MSGPLRHALLGFRGAFRRPGLVLLHGGLDLLGTVTALLPIILASMLLLETLFQALPLALLTFDAGLPGRALLARSTAASFYLPIAGLALSGAVLTGVLRVFFLSGALGVLAEDMKDVASSRTFMNRALSRFPSGLGTGALIVLFGLLWVAWSIGMLIFSGMIYAAGIEHPDSAGLGGAAALALSITLLVVTSIAFEILARLSITRVFVMREGPAVAIYEALSLAMRRLGHIVMIAVVFALAQLFVAIAVSSMMMPLAFLSPEAMGSGWTTAARAVGWIIRAMAMALPALAAYGAYAALVLDDAGELPAPSPPPERQPLPISVEEPLAIARPLSAVVVAVPVVEARPIEEEN